MKSVGSIAPKITIGPGGEKEALEQSHRDSINSVTSQPLHESAVPSCPLSRANSTASNQVAAIGLGIYTPAGGSIYGSPPPSRPGTAMSNRVYQQRNVSTSSLSLKGFTPPTNFLTPTRPAPVAFPDSAYKAIHPPSHHFRHSPSPLRPGASIRAVPASPYIGVLRTPTGHSRTSTFTSLPTIPADSQPLWLQTNSDATEATSGSTLSIATHSSVSTSATGSTESSISKIKHKRCSSDITIPSTLAERRESGGSNLTERLDSEIDHLNKRRQGLTAYENFVDASEELELELPDPLFMRRECSESSSLGYCGPTELNIDRFPRRVDSLHNMRASPV
jgi:flagellin-like hook-associated protein FlgL